MFFRVAPFKPQNVSSLRSRNVCLCKNSTNENTKRIIEKEYRLKFGSENLCFAYLAEAKWNGGYCCRKCNNELFIFGKKKHNRRCSCCGYSESPTANTLFHKIKCSIKNGSEMAYDIGTMNKGLQPKIDKTFINQYIQECFFRFNRLNFRATILEKLLDKMIAHSSMTYKSIKCNAT